MGLRSAIIALLPRAFARVGEDAVFTPASGPAETCKVCISRDVDLQAMGLAALAWDRATTIEALISADPAAAGIAISREPVEDETFTVLGETYKFKAVLTDDGLSVTMLVV